MLLLLVILVHMREDEPRTDRLCYKTFALSYLSTNEVAIQISVTASCPAPELFCLKANKFVFFLLCGKILRAMITRYIEEEIRKDLEEKMVFLSGPRQVRKTTLAKSLLTRWTSS